MNIQRAQHSVVTSFSLHFLVQQPRVLPVYVFPQTTLIQCNQYSSFINIDVEVVDVVLSPVSVSFLSSELVHHGGTTTAENCEAKGTRDFSSLLKTGTNRLLRSHPVHCALLALLDIRLPPRFFLFCFCTIFNDEPFCPLPQYVRTEKIDCNDDPTK